MVWIGCASWVGGVWFWGGVGLCFWVRSDLGWGCSVGGFGGLSYVSGGDLNLYTLLCLLVGQCVLFYWVYGGFYFVGLVGCIGAGLRLEVWFLLVSV